MMLTRLQLADIARREGLPLHTVEGDYVMHIFLRHAGTDDLAFKGGTCLRIAYGSPRYSVDLDFTALNGPDRVERALRPAAERLGDYGIPAQLAKRPSREGYAARLTYDGPLYDGNPRSRGSIRIEVSLRGERVDSEERFVPRTPYPDVPQLLLRILTKDHLLAEKTRALIVRSAPRDLYDVSFLLGLGVRCTRGLVDEKMSLYRRRFSWRALDAGIQRAGSAWERDLGPLLGVVPPNRAIVRGVKEGLRTLFG